MSCRFIVLSILLFPASVFVDNRISNVKIGSFLSNVTDYKKIFHFDFYRIEDEEEALDIGLEDYLDSGNICLIEWPNKITNFVPDNHQTISIEILEDGSRQITVNK